jgi:hypothetical protein
MVFFRLQGAAMNYSSESNRGVNLLNDPWLEFPPIQKLFGN